MAGPTTPPYDPYWRDVDGVPIPPHCRVEQIAVDKSLGALPSRLHRKGQVYGRGTVRLWVLFDGEGTPVSVRPHLLRVCETPGATDTDTTIPTD